jgi:hypothetical protein
MGLHIHIHRLMGGFVTHTVEMDPNAITTASDIPNLIQR